MIKVIAFVKRKPTVSHEEFVRHYEEIHAPLALRLFPAIKKYVRNHIVTAPGAKAPDFDCITEFWFDDMASSKTVIETRLSEAGKPIRDDEDTFMDLTEMVSFVVGERVSK